MNDNNNFSEIENIKGWIKVWLIIIAMFTPLIAIIAAMVIHDEKAKCAVSYCNDKHMSGSEYCYYHYKSNQSPKKSQSKSSSTSKTYSSTYKSNTGKSNVGSSTAGSSKASSKTSTKSYMNDPMDYDSPEDYADDAWGYDFDDWDDAYEYWEDIMD